MDRDAFTLRHHRCATAQTKGAVFYRLKRVIIAKLRSHLAIDYIEAAGAGPNRR